MLYPQLEFNLRIDFLDPPAGISKDIILILIKEGGLRNDHPKYVKSKA